MKFFTVAALSAICLLSFVSNTQAQTADTGKVAVINTNAFGLEKGITKYISALDKLDAEFAPRQKELEAMATKLASLNKEIETLRTQAQTGAVPFNQGAAQAKVDEADKLSRDAKFKQEDAQASYNRRLQVVLGPIQADIGKALTEFAKAKGYALVFDIAKDREGLLIAIGNEKADITTDFIAFYNARP